MPDDLARTKPSPNVQTAIAAVQPQALARLGGGALADKRRYCIRRGQAQVVEHLANRLVPIQGERNDQPNDLLRGQTSVSNAHRMGANDCLFNPIIGQMLPKPPPIGRLQTISEKMKGVVEHCDAG